MKKNHRTQGSPKFIPFITEEGLQASIKMVDIPKANWTHYHGQTAAGEDVNSMQMQKIGKSLLIQGIDTPMLSVPQTDAEVAFTKYLRENGFTVTPPSKA